MTDNTDKNKIIAILKFVGFKRVGYHNPAVQRYRKDNHTLSFWMKLIIVNHKTLAYSTTPDEAIKEIVRQMKQEDRLNESQIL